MEKIVLDSVLRTRLNGLNQHLELCDETGRTIGHYLPLDAYKKLLYSSVEAACPFSKEEQERRRQEKGGISLAEFWKKLGVS